jgi:translation initiation factor IF-2
VAQVHQEKAAQVWLWADRLADRVAVRAQTVLQPMAQLAGLLLFQVSLVLRAVTHHRQRVLVVAVRQQRARTALRQLLPQPAERDMTSVHSLAEVPVLSQEAEEEVARPPEEPVAHQSEERARQAQTFQDQTRQQTKVQAVAARQEQQEHQVQGRRVS